MQTLIVYFRAFAFALTLNLYSDCSLCLWFESMYVFVCLFIRFGLVQQNTVTTLKRHNRTNTTGKWIQMEKRRRMNKRHRKKCTDFHLPDNWHWRKSKESLAHLDTLWMVLPNEFAVCPKLSECLMNIWYGRDITLNGRKHAFCIWKHCPKQCTTHP